MPAGPWHGLPEFGPGGWRGAIGKAPRPHQDRRRRHLDNPACRKRDMKRMIFRAEQAGDVQAAPARDKCSVGVEERWKAGECRDDLSLVALHEVTAFSNRPVSIAWISNARKRE